MNSVLTTLRVFEEVALRQPIGVSELARATDMAKSSVHRCLTTLQTAGWLRVVDPDRVLWGLTMKALSLGLRGAGEQNFRDAAAPVISRLAAETDETVHVGLRDGDHWVVLDRKDTTQMVRVFIEVGRRLPLRATSAGVAIMALLDDDDIDVLLKNDDVDFAEFPTLSVDELRKEIALTRRRGYAANISSSWYRPPVASIAVAVVNAAHAPVGAVVLSIPEGRYDRSRQRSLAGLVTAAAQEISQLVASA